MFLLLSLIFIYLNLFFLNVAKDLSILFTFSEKNSPEFCWVSLKHIFWILCWVNQRSPCHWGELVEKHCVPLVLSRFLIFHVPWSSALLFCHLKQESPPSVLTNLSNVSKLIFPLPEMRAGTSLLELWTSTKSFSSTGNCLKKKISRSSRRGTVVNESH